jgi:cyclopropane fatty-acyl-phospholipid synthase-like methyltransferase
VTNAVHAMYDALAWYVQFENWRARGSRFADFSLHKSLDVEASGDRFAATRHVNELLLRHGGLPRKPRVLDAGCGFGGTVFHLHAKLGGTYDGITLSRPQQRVASKQARRSGIDDACRFHLRSYDDAIAGRYDAVIAVESLSHAPDLRRTIANLASSLVPGGRLVLVEDMAAEAIEASHPSEAHLLREHWGCRPFPSIADHETALAAAGLQVVERIDLTPRVRHRPIEQLERARARYSALQRRIPVAMVRRVLSAYLGGIALEKLYAAGKARYSLLVATREESACQDYRAPAIPG